LTRSATEIENNKNPVGNMWTPLTVLFILSMVPIFIIFFLMANEKTLDKEPFKSAWGSLYTNLDTIKPSRYLFYVAFLFRRILYAFSINDLIFIPF
jgi:flagellar basal body-associated protein FliL